MASCMLHFYDSIKITNFKTLRRFDTTWSLHFGESFALINMKLNFHNIQLIWDAGEFSKEDISQCYSTALIWFVAWAWLVRLLDTLSQLHPFSGSSWKMRWLKWQWFQLESNCSWRIRDAGNMYVKRGFIQTWACGYTWDDSHGSVIW